MVKIEVNSKCATCSFHIKDCDMFCEQCGSKVLRCRNCNSVIKEYSGFCGFCGANLEEQLNLIMAEEKEQVMLSEIKNQTSDLLIEYGGNKFSVIGKLKELFNLDTETATSIVNDVYFKMDNTNTENLTDNSKNNNDNQVSVETIVKNNDFNENFSISEVQEKYGYSYDDAKKAVNDVILKLKSTGEYINPKGIKKTVIVATSSRKKATSAIARGAIGGVLLGPIGLFAGLSAKSKDTSTFQIYYNDGTITTMTVKNGSWAFNNLCQYLKE